MSSHGVQISIARSVQKRVYEPHLMAFFCFAFFFFIMRSLFLGTRRFVQC